MEIVMKILEDHGMTGLFIISLLYVIKNHFLPSFERIAETNAKQAESLVEVSKNLIVISEKIESVRSEVLQKIELIKKS